MPKQNAGIISPKSVMVKIELPYGKGIGRGQKVKKERPAGCYTCGPPGGLFGIDQEVVTLRGLYGNSGLVFATILTDLRQAESILTHR